MNLTEREQLLQQLGIVRWQLRDQPAPAGTAAVPESDTAAMASEGLHAATTYADTESATPRKLHLVLPPSAAHRQVCADIVHFLRWRGVACQTLNSSELNTLPPPPAVCFDPDIVQARRDEDGRLLLPMDPAAGTAQQWKSLLWSYLQPLLIH